MNIATNTKTLIAISIGVSLIAASHCAVAASVTEVLASGKANLDLNLRFESVDQDNALENASALTLRTRVGYTTGSINGFSAKVEMEDNRIVLGQGDYTVGPTGYNLGQYSVVADPEHTELDQGYIQYKQDNFVAKLGRQVITFDNHRFIGHVGWRQDRQTFDGITAQFSPIENLSVTYAFVNQRNRIFAESTDLDSKDHFLNAGYTTSLGKLTGYGYLFEVDSNTNNKLDTYGLRFSGATKEKGTKFLYAAEYATQTAEAADLEFEADYLLLEVGAAISGITIKATYELLGSDNANYGFSTPLATLHKFNGWADQFLGTPAEGLVDKSVTVSGKVAGGSWAAIFHDFEADNATDAIDDLGSEINLQYSMKFAKHYTAAIKYAAYSGASGRADADKIWLWLSAGF